MLNATVQSLLLIGGALVLLSGTNQSMLLSGANESMVLNEAKQSILLNGGNQSMLFNGANQSMLLNGGNQSMLLNRANQSMLFNGANQSMLLKGANQSMLLNRANQSMLLNETVQPPLVCMGVQYLRFQVTTSVTFSAVATNMLNIPASVTAVISNILLINVIQFKRVVPPTASNLLLATMAWSDLLIGIIVLPINVIIRTLDALNVHICPLKSVYAFTAVVLCAFSTSMAVMVSMDRYIVISNPLKHKSWNLHNKYKRVMFTFMMFWILISSLAISKLVHTVVFNAFMILQLISVGILVVIFYIRLHYSIKEHDARVVPHTVVLSQTNARMEAERKRERRRAVTISLVVVLHILCYTPKIVCVITRTLTNNDFLTMYSCNRWAETIIYINSALNPLLYCYRIETIRNGVSRILRRVFRLEQVARRV